jgi:acyl-CoA thioesterase-2
MRPTCHLIFRRFTTSSSAYSSSPQAVITPLDAALTLSEIEPNLFLQHPSSLWRPPNARSVFGGQIFGAAMLAAERTSVSRFPLHAAHAHFLRPGVSGSGAAPIVYEVTRLRDGASFDSRAVSARQGGEVLLVATISFHRREIDTTNGMIGHAEAAPVGVLEPELCPKLGIASALNFPVEVRAVPPDASTVDINNAIYPARALAWFRCPPLPAPSPSTAHLHRAALAFASDWGLGTVGLLPYALRWGDKRVAMAASLDHSLHFHDAFDGGGDGSTDSQVVSPVNAPSKRAVASASSSPSSTRVPLKPLVRHANAPNNINAPHARADDWLLFELSCHIYRNSRAMNQSRVWTRGGTLVATATQESVIRLRGDE